MKTGMKVADIAMAKRLLEEGEDIADVAATYEVTPEIVKACIGDAPKKRGRPPKEAEE